jgi:hypothetical protein
VGAPSFSPYQFFALPPQIRSSLANILLQFPAENLYTHQIKLSESVQRVKWYIRTVYTPIVGEQWDNQEVFARISAHLRGKVDRPETEIDHLLSLIRVFLIGSRSRYVQCPYFLDLSSFKDHATAFAAAVAESIGALTKDVKAAGSEGFDAVIGVSSVGQLLPGIADRLATGLRDQVKGDALLLDLSNGGCTASSRALQLASTLDTRHRNVLIAVVEPTSTLADPDGSPQLAGYLYLWGWGSRYLAFYRPGRSVGRTRTDQFLASRRCGCDSLGL